MTAIDTSSSIGRVLVNVFHSSITVCTSACAGAAPFQPTIASRYASPNSRAFVLRASVSPIRMQQQPFTRREPAARFLPFHRCFDAEGIGAAADALGDLAAAIDLQD